MVKQFQNKYFMLDEVSILKNVFDTCAFPCQATKLLPKESYEYKTETKPDKLGQFYNADVMEGSGQKILLLRENLTS